MLIIQQHDFIDEIGYLLEEIYEDLESKFNISESNLKNFKNFEKYGLLPLFLYDKQKYLDRFCSEKLAPNTYIKIHYFKNNEVDEPSKLDIEHNINTLSDYKKALEFITILIVTDSRLNAQQHKELMLDDYYNSFSEYFKKLPLNKS